ncbi:MAG: right-handed parallel beta-helix repeat-containing protein, partial [Geminicoccaceae bacterium]
PVENIGIGLAIDNAPGAPDTLTGADAITGGPVSRFTFEYDSSMSAPGTVGVSSIRFDLTGGGGGGGGGGSDLPPGFDGLQYIASYADLTAAFGADRAAGEAHYLNAGKAEGRRIDLFSETQYLKNYGDLQAAFGHDANQATIHYISSGANEGRTDDAPSPAEVDGLQYIASNPDLIAAFGANAAAGQQHYAQFGQAENRLLDNFNETQYLGNYADLSAAFGDNTDAATTHYIQAGFAEGRNDFII